MRNKVGYDKDGTSWLINSDGDFVTDERGNKIPPSSAPIIGESSGWKEYDTSRGHCGLCGSLHCRGNCFK